MKYCHLIISVVLASIIMLSCNNTASVEGEGASLKSENAETSIEGEKFPDGGGFKGRYNDRVFYIEVKESGVSGFVRYKKSGIEHKVSGSKTSPFDFECIESGAQEETVAKLRGKMSNNELGADLEYTLNNSSESIRVQVER